MLRRKPTPEAPNAAQSGPSLCWSLLHPEQRAGVAQAAIRNIDDVMSQLQDARGQVEGVLDGLREALNQGSNVLPFASFGALPAPTTTEKDGDGHGSETVPRQTRRRQQHPGKSDQSETDNDSRTFLEKWRRGNTGQKPRASRQPLPKSQGSTPAIVDGMDPNAKNGAAYYIVVAAGSNGINRNNFLEAAQKNPVLSENNALTTAKEMRIDAILSTLVRRGAVTIKGSRGQSIWTAVPGWSHKRASKSKRPIAGGQDSNLSPKTRAFLKVLQAKKRQTHDELIDHYIEDDVLNPDHRVTDRETIGNRIDGKLWELRRAGYVIEEYAADSNKRKLYSAATPGQTKPEERQPKPRQPRGHRTNDDDSNDDQRRSQSKGPPTYTKLPPLAQPANSNPNAWLKAVEEVERRLDGKPSFDEVLKYFQQQAKQGSWAVSGLTGAQLHNNVVMAFTTIHAEEEETTKEEAGEEQEEQPPGQTPSDPKKAEAAAEKALDAVLGKKPRKGMGDGGNTRIPRGSTRTIKTNDDWDNTVVQIIGSSEDPLDSEEIVSKMIDLGGSKSYCLPANLDEDEIPDQVAAALSRLLTKERIRQLGGDLYIIAR